MTTWYGGHGWGWCSMMFNNPATVLLWAAVVAAMVLAVRFAVRRPSNPAAPTTSGPWCGRAKPRTEPITTNFTVG